jgi:biotin-(acetyl-CoA carboxylase) ligase
MNLRLLHLNTVDSTNTYLDRLAKEGYPHGTVVIADTQTAGRGRFGRVWFSPPGKNIYMSILVRPSGLTVTSPPRGESKSEHGILPMLAGVACARAINKILNQRSEVRGQKSDISATVRQCDRTTVTPSLNFPLKGGYQFGLH